METMSLRIDPLSPDTLEEELAAFVHLLKEAVDRGASLGFFAPLDPEVARDYWRSLRGELRDGSRLLLAARASDGRVVYMNAAAEHQIRAGNSIRIVNSQLTPSDPAARAALSKAIEKAARDDIDKDVREHSLAFPDVDGGSGYIATLLPVERGQRRAIMAPFAASVAVFTKDPVHAPVMPGEAFARLYKLTGGELRVLLALAQGLGAKEAADMLGISEPTVRTHLQHMFAKTHTLRQADLLRLLQTSTPAVRAP